MVNAQCTNTEIGRFEKMPNRKIRSDCTMRLHSMADGSSLLQSRDEVVRHRVEARQSPLRSLGIPEIKPIWCQSVVLYMHAVQDGKHRHALSQWAS